MKLQQIIYRARKTALIRVALVIVAIGASSRAEAAEFYAIIANFTQESGIQAQLDMGGDTQALPGGAPIPYQFNVFASNGTVLTQFEVISNPQGFASSSWAAAPNNDLFKITGGLPALVSVRTPQSSSLFSSVLLQTLKKSAFAFAIPQARAHDGSGVGIGKQFTVPVGGFSSGSATLLVANVSGSDVAVDVFIGSKGAPGGGKYGNPRLKNNTLWILDIDPIDAYSHLIVTSTNDILVQLATKDGKAITEVAVLPLQ